MGHRYMAGHDLLLDIPRTTQSHGFIEGLNQSGHILLTDFPTKAGIPIPGFSYSGLGKMLEECGLHRGWLQLNLSDAHLGILAIAEGSTDLLSALQGTLEMSHAVFFDTFVEGGIEVVFALSTQNPLALIGGLENILAGLVATYNKLSVYVDPLDFFGAAGVSAIIGFSLAIGLAQEDLKSATVDAIRSGIVGSLFSVSAAFGFGALAGFSTYRIGALLAQQQNESLNASLSVDLGFYKSIVEELSIGNPEIRLLLEKAIRAPIPSDTHLLESGGRELPSSPILLSDQAPLLNTTPSLLPSAGTVLEEYLLQLKADPITLAQEYKDILNSNPPSFSAPGNRG
jgi:hypothetical protein